MSPEDPTDGSDLGHSAGGLQKAASVLSSHTDLQRGHLTGNSLWSLSRSMVWCDMNRRRQARKEKRLPMCRAARGRLMRSLQTGGAAPRGRTAKRRGPRAAPKKTTSLQPAALTEKNRRHKAHGLMTRGAAALPKSVSDGGLRDRSLGSRFEPQPRNMLQPRRLCLIGPLFPEIL